MESSIFQELDRFIFLLTLIILCCCYTEDFKTFTIPRCIMKDIEENPSTAVLDGEITGIRFGLASRDEISKSSISDCPISHPSQLSNPFLGLPLESGKCESCGTDEIGECEGHFGYIELPTPIYHPSHVSELKRLLSLLCLKCRKMKKKKKQSKDAGVAERVFSSCCEEAAQVSIVETKASDGACYLELKTLSRSSSSNGFWHFLEQYGFRYGDGRCRPLLPSEVIVILRNIPQESRNMLSAKGIFVQEGYIMQYLPVPPNCLSVPDVSDGSSVMSSDCAISVLKKVMKQAYIIKSSRSGIPNFESTMIEANDLQVTVAEYLQVRDAAKASHDTDGRFSIKKDGKNLTKVQLEKMRTLFIRKGTGFSSRSIVTGDPYKGVGEIGLPFEIARRITFEEKVSQHNMTYLQKLVDKKQCIEYNDGLTTYSLQEGSKGHTLLRDGRFVRRRVMDGDIVIINRPPTTHKHSLQALSVYVHDGHTVKINPLICAPLGADFDGDAIHIFYPQSLSARAEVSELLSVERQLLSSHNGNLNLQLATDSVLSLRLMFKKYFLSRVAAQQLALFVSGVLPSPALPKAQHSESQWTVLQLLQTALPPKLDCFGERHNIWESQLLEVDYSRDLMQSIINDVATSIFFGKSPFEVLRFFNSLQPMLMENLYAEGYSVGLEDFCVPNDIVHNIQACIQELSSLLYHMRLMHNEMMALQLEKQIRHLKVPITNHILKASAMGNLIDSKSESAINKVVQQIGFLGLQISDRGKLYSKTLVADIAILFQKKYPFSANYPSEGYGLVRGCLYHGLDPYQLMVHSISSREVIIRSSRGLTEPGMLFKNLMAILRDIVICYDGTVRNVCSNSIVQFEYGKETGTLEYSSFAAGDSVGALAATAMSNPSYKAVLDSSPSSNNSWVMMKEILLCGVKFRNDDVDRRLILYLNHCDCGRKHCAENAAYSVKKQLKKISLKDAAVEAEENAAYVVKKDVEKISLKDASVEFLIGYNTQQTEYDRTEIDSGLVGHFHLNELLMKDSNISMDEVLEKCQDTVYINRKKKRVGHLFRNIELSVSQMCFFPQSSKSEVCGMPCLKFFWKDNGDIHLEKSSQIFADTICPVMLETIIKGDPRVCTADIIWVSPKTTSWIRNCSSSEKGELAINLVLEKKFVKKTGDAWRIGLDCCLPVMHLIDTRRSVPCSVKQLQELLGITCAFEQAIQRLLTSVTMVAKVLCCCYTEDFKTFTIPRCIMKDIEENPSTAVLDGEITGIRFGLASRDEISKSSISDCPISHPSQLSNPFLGLPLESGKCESCGTDEIGECEGHFGYIELPTPIYHPSHVSELKRLLSLLCLKCRKMKKKKKQSKDAGVAERVFSSCCEEAAQVSIVETKASDGACYLELKTLSRSSSSNGFWHFLEQYGFRYGDGRCRPLLPSEVIVILRNIPQESRNMLSAKGIFVQEGYIMQYLPVPPNCLSVPDVSDGSSVMSSDCAISVLKKVMKQAYIIKSSRSGIPNFESTMIEANDLQVTVAEYLQVRDAAKASHDTDGRFSIKKDGKNLTKVQLEKMRTLFIRKGTGFSSRSIVTGDPYKGVGEIGLPFEIARRITFEEKVSQHNMTYLQKLVDKKQCIEYNDGLTTYSLQEGSKGHTLLRDGRFVRRRVMDGDIVIINRPPTTHKHSLQALSVYVHDGHTVKINPLICAPLGADFDGDAIHIFYPQSLSARAEVSELLSVERQLLSSHNGNLNLQLATDSVLSLRLMFKKYFLSRVAAQQLALFVSGVLPSPALPKAQHSESQWTVLQLLQTALPPKLDCFGERHNIWESQLLEVDYSRDLMQSIINDVATSIFFGKSPFEVLRFFNSLQPMLMENLYAEGYSVGLEDFCVPNDIVHNIQACIQELSSLLYHMRLMHNEMMALQLEKQIRHLKVPITNHILKASAMGNLIDSKSESAINKVVQQIGFLGLQISDRGKLYSKTLVADIAILFQKKYPFSANYPSEGYGLVRGCLYHGLDPYQLMVHSISSREVIIRSSRGLTEPGMLFKNLMAILRDIVICYDGTVRNVCSNSIVQFEYGKETGTLEYSSFAAGDSVGALAATAMSNPSYKAVLDSSPSSNNSWVMMKEILLCGVKFRNDDVDRRLILYLNHCDCGRKHCAENAAYSVKKQLKKISLKDAAVEFLIEYNTQQTEYDRTEIDSGLVGHFHLNELLMKDSNISMDEVLEKCQDTVYINRKKKRVGHLFRNIELSVSQMCFFPQSSKSEVCGMPCLKFFWKDNGDIHLEKSSQIFADTICPVMLETIIKGDPRVCTADIIWVSPKTTSWIRNCSSSEKGELAINLVLEKKFVKKTGDAWRIGLDCCLPVMHLIDTRRSVPCSVKQLQELLGITCAFEQAIQRLLTSVTMVAKEATLFTPKKCFEVAAEKCHVDSLASIVASCSWGKHAAVGTGSSFDIYYDTGEVEMNQTDVHDFLNIVRSTEGVEKNSSCLGAEMDDLYLTSDEHALSPDHASENPVFEDSVGFGIANQNVLDRETQSLSENVGAWGRSAVEDSGVHARWSAEVAREEKAKKFSEKVEKIVTRSFPDETANPEKNNHPDHVSGLVFSSGHTKEDQGTSFGDRRHKSSHPFNKASSESIPTGMTASGRRLDMFTDDEQELLVEIEPIMQSVRKIMDQPGYNDGDPLATDDQGYIIEHIFNFHPNKVEKMGAGINYVMINKHSSFQNSRCLHIVRTDGHKEDFSYIKCLKNYMKEKFPNRAESFMGKYFMRRNQPPRAGLKERNTPETGTSSRVRGNKDLNLSDSEDKKNRKGWSSWTNALSSVPEGATTDKKSSGFGE
ncbi:hypothetical protein POM88_036586 [Heracleum sosnowskyi]|uniref:DNA-directed RNA polymerase subunit n=1 Tax=Heracleum sosnowskyi TaxID=360622 RepID=A0AAD8HNL5_9APIA|nr:hypothetical protein POM88_036586 [Heracleum sosnowskyi]